MKRGHQSAIFPRARLAGESLHLMNLLSHRLKCYGKVIIRASILFEKTILRLYRMRVISYSPDICLPRILNSSPFAMRSESPPISSWRICRLPYSSSLNRQISDDGEIDLISKSILLLGYHW